MRVRSVNVCGNFVMVPHAGTEEPTAHFKRSVSGPVALGELGLEGDRQADQRYHGGPHQAVYLLSREIIGEWESALGRPLPPGSFGENLTVDGLPDELVRIGDRLAVGHDGPILEVSIPRGPCFKLGYAMNDPEFPKRFLATCRVGFYARVIRGGTIAAGDAITLMPRSPSISEDSVTVRDITRLRYFGRSDREGARRAAGIEALAPVWREEFAQRAES